MVPQSLHQSDGIQVTPAQLLRHEADKLRHAVSRDRIIVDGRVESEHEYHYLTCKRCDLERRAQAIDDYYRGFVEA